MHNFFTKDEFIKYFSIFYIYESFAYYFRKFFDFFNFIYYNNVNLHILKVNYVGKEEFWRALGA